MNYEFFKDQLTPNEITELKAAELRYLTFLRDVRAGKIWGKAPYWKWVFKYYDEYQRDRELEKVQGKPIKTRQPKALQRWNQYQKKLKANKKERKRAREAKKMVRLAAGLGHVAQKTQTPNSKVSELLTALD